MAMLNNQMVNWLKKSQYYTSRGTHDHQGVHGTSWISALEFQHFRLVTLVIVSHRFVDYPVEIDGLQIIIPVTSQLRRVILQVVNSQEVALSENMVYHGIPLNPWVYQWFIKLVP